MATWDLTNTKHHLLLCNGSSCNKAGAEELTQAIRKEISDQNLDDVIHTTRTRCNGRCHDKCVVIDYPSGTWYMDLYPQEVACFIDALLEEEVYEGKVSHVFNGSGFDRAPHAVKGVKKEKENVKRVSK